MLKFYHTEVGNWLTDLTLNVFQRGAIQAHHSTEVLGKHCIRTLETFKQTKKKIRKLSFSGRWRRCIFPYSSCQVQLKPLDAVYKINLWMLYIKD